MSKFKLLPPHKSFRDRVELREDKRWYFKDIPANKNYRKHIAIGFSNSKYYVGVKIDGVNYGANRIIYWLNTGEWPDIVDHIDRDRTNNEGSNLRAATPASNKINSTTSYNIKTHVKADGSISYVPAILLKDEETGKRKYYHIGSYKDEASALYAAWKIRDLLFPGFCPVPDQIKKYVS